MTDLAAARAHIEAALAILAGADNAPAIPHFEVYAKHLDLEEGRKPYAYLDHLGYQTIGVGRLIDKRKGGRLTDAEIDILLANDIREKLAGMEADPKIAPAWARVKDNPARACALLSMAFQMGVKGLAGFTTTLGRIATGNFAGAAASARDSLWAKQTPERAARVTRMLETGKLG